MAFTANERTVSELFQATFARQVSSQDALTAWVARYEAKLSGGSSASVAQQSILAEMGTSAESQAVYAGKTDAETVDFIFSNSLGRAAAEPGRTAWIDRAATIPLEQLQNEILASARTNDDFVYMDNLVNQAEDDLGGSDTGTQFTLTNGTDIATASQFEANMVFTPDGSDRILSLQDEDILTGTTGRDDNTLHAVLGNINADEGTTAVVTPVLENIQIINVDFTGNTRTLDLRYSDSVNTININKITADGAVANLRNIQTAASELRVAQVHDNASVITFDYVRGVLDGVETMSLTMDNVLANSVITQADTGALNEGFESVNLNVTNGVDLRTSLSITDMENLTITGSDYLDILNLVWTTNEYNAFSAALLNPGSIGQRTIDASTYTGKLNLDVSLGMGAKVDPDNSGALFHTAITGGLGDDVFHTNVGMVASANGTQDGIEGGTGANTLVSYNGGIAGNSTGTTDGHAVAITNIQTLELREQGAVGVVDIDAFDDQLASIYMRDEDAGATTFTLNDLTVDLAASGMTLAHNIAVGGAQTVIGRLKDATGGTDTMALTVVDSESLTPGVFNFTFQAEGTDTDGIAGNVNTGVAATSDADAIENVILHDNDTEGNTVTLTNAINHTGSVVLDGGTAGLGYTVVNTLNAATVDASAQASNLRLVVGDTVGTITSIAQDVKLGTGDDVLTFANIDEFGAGDSLTDAGGNDTVRALFANDSNLSLSDIENLHVAGTANVTLGMAGAAVTNLVLLSDTAIDVSAPADVDFNGVQEPFGVGPGVVLATNIVTLDSSTLTELNFFADADNNDANNGIAGADDVVNHIFNGVTLANNSASDLTVNINTSLDFAQTAAVGGGAASYTLGQITTHGNTGMNIILGNERSNLGTTTTINNIYAKTMETLTATSVGNINFGTVSGAPLNNSLKTFDMSAVSGRVTANIISLGDDAKVTLSSDANHVVNALGSAGKLVTITAGNGNNTLTGTAQSDTITTGSGWDTIAADRGDNVITAGAGNDTVTGKDGNDTVDLGTGIDNYTDNFNTAIDGSLATTTVSISGGVSTIIIDTDGSGTVTVGDDNQLLAVGSGSDLTVSWLGGALQAATAVLDGALASVDVMVSTSNSDLVIATAAGGDAFSGGAGNDVYITERTTGSFLTFTGGSGNDAAVGSDGTDLFTGGTGADLYVMQNSTTLDADVDVVTIADGDSTTSGWDIVSGFDATGAGAVPAAAAVAGTNVGADKLNLDSTTIAAIAGAGGVANGNIATYTVLANGVVTFQDAGAVTHQIGAGNDYVAGNGATDFSLAEAMTFLSSNVAAGDTVLFNYDANASNTLTAADSTFVFQGGANDTVVELIGTYTGLEAAAAAGGLVEIA